MINANEIEVVIQGPVSRKIAAQNGMGETAAVIASLRRILPEASVILSTWRGADVSGIEVDRVVFSDDPGSFPQNRNDEQQRNNVNRQIVSTLAGLRACSRKYTLKLRSDTSLDHADFLTWFELFPARNLEGKILEKRVLAWAAGSRHPRKSPSVANSARVLFHPSDFVFFGLRQDLLNIWDIPLMTAVEADWFAMEPPRWASPRMKNRFYPEDFIWTSFLKKNGYTPVAQSWVDFDPELLRASELTIVNNLQLLDQAQFGFHCFKYPLAEGSMWGHEYLRNFTHWDWEILYRDYCDPAYQPPAFDWLQWRVMRKDGGRSFLKYYLRCPERRFRWLRDRLQGRKPWPWNY